MRLIPDDLLLMTAWHLAPFPALFLAAWYVLTAVPAVRRWLRGRLDRE